MTSRAEKRREGRRDAPDRGSRLGWLIGSVAILAAVLAWNFLMPLLDRTARRPVDVEYSSPEELIELAQGMSSGNPDARVTVMEFGDYQCPACLDFFRGAKPFLDLSYVQPGAVEFVYHDYPNWEIHPHAFVAARAARCAGDQSGYWPYHDTLFQNQGAWSSEKDPVGTFVDYADDLGLDRGAFGACVRSDRHAVVVSANLLLASQLGADRTPTVILNPDDASPVRVDNWAASLLPTLDEMLAEPGGSQPSP